MPKRRLTPQEKKALSYARDCRNTYGENDKASRKAIPLRKAASIRKERRKLNASAENEVKGLGVAETPRRNKQAWKKASDTPLGQFVSRKLEYRQTEGYNAKAKRRKKQSEFLAALQLKFGEKAD
jgi:hypothetical protein